MGEQHFFIFIILLHMQMKFNILKLKYNIPTY